MRSRGLLMLVIAVVAGIAAVLMAARWMQLQGGDKGRIAVANVDVELGGRITPEMIRMVDWPQSSVPAGAFNDMSKLQGRVVKTSLQRGEPFMEARLAPEGTKGGLSAVVPEGKRAMTVRVNDVVGVAGFALPGTFVDVMVNTQEEGSQRGDKDHTISKIVLERILVLAVAQEADRDTTKPKVVNAVTLELTPKEAEIIDLARSVGTLSLVLRNQTDPKVTSTEGATKSMLLGLRVPAPAPAAATQPVAMRAPAPRQARTAPAPEPAAAKHCVEVIRGIQKVTECF
jgi:pilus assembly protein CpaB